MSNVGKYRRELLGGWAIGKNLVVPFERLRVVIEANRFATERHFAIVSNPFGIIGMQDFTEKLADDSLSLEPGQGFEGWVDLQEAIVARTTLLVANDLMQGKALGHRIEKLAIPVVARSPRLIGIRRHVSILFVSPSSVTTRSCRT